MIKCLFSIIGLSLSLMAPKLNFAANINAPHPPSSEAITARGVLSASQTADILQTQLKDCSLYAPFPGHVTARHISAYETSQMGQKLYSLECARPIELSIIVPSKWIKWIEKGQTFEFTVDATDETFTAKIIRIGTTVDLVSQTLKIIGTPKALTGMSGLARFENTP